MVKWNTAVNGRGNEEDVGRVVWLILSEFEHGSTIRSEWFMENLWIPKPVFVKTANLEVSLKRYDKERDDYKLAYMGCIVRIKTALRKHKVYLNSIRGIGYKILTPNEHATHAVHKVLVRTDRAFRKAHQCMNSCDTAALSDVETHFHVATHKKILDVQEIFATATVSRGMFKTEKENKNTDSTPD